MNQDAVDIKFHVHSLFQIWPKQKQKSDSLGFNIRMAAGWIPFYRHKILLNRIPV